MLKHNFLKYCLLMSPLCFSDFSSASEANNRNFKNRKLDDHRRKKNSIQIVNSDSIENPTNLYGPHEFFDIVSSEIDQDLDSLPTINVNLFGNETDLVFEHKAVDSKINDGTSAWYGETSNYDGDVIGTMNLNRVGPDNRLIGSISANDMVISINTRPDGKTKIEATPTKDFPNEYDPFEFPSSTTQQSQNDKTTKSSFEQSSQDDGSVIDVLVGYTKAAMCAEAGLPSNCPDTTANRQPILDRIDLAIFETNVAYTQSGVNTQIRLSDTFYDPDYDDSGDFKTMLYELQDPNDGFIDQAHALRNSSCADMVALIVENTNYCGIAFLGPDPDLAFSVTARNCMTGYYSFGHELGHNMGCHHNRGATSVSTKYSHGFLDPNSEFRSILSYKQCPGSGTCTRVQRFSNTKFLWKNQPIGSNNENNAQHINDVRVEVSKFRDSAMCSSSSLPPTPTPPSNGQVLSSTMEGGNGQAGNMFDIVALKDIKITGFDIHTSSGLSDLGSSSVIVKVFTKSGGYASQMLDASAWVELSPPGGLRVVPMGKGKLTPLGPKAMRIPVAISKGSTQAFYVTLTTPGILYTDGTKVGSVFAENDDIQVLEGSGISFPFNATFEPRLFNGRIFYEPCDTSEITTTTPNKMPSNSPITFPTQFPTPFQSTVPTPTFPKSLKTLMTTMKGGNGNDGSMFDIDALKNITIRGFDIHTSSTSAIFVKVFTKKGSYVSALNNETLWTELTPTGGVSLTGKGQGSYTSLGLNAMSPVPIAANTTQAFYVTLAYGPMIYTTGGEAGAVFTQNDDLLFREGAGVVYPFSNSFSPRIFNGRIYYNETSSSPFVSPTASPPTVVFPFFPTASPPISSPTNGPSTNIGGNVSKILATTMAGGNGQAGNMFDIDAFKTITITSFDIHTSSSSTNNTAIAMVFTKSGPYADAPTNASAWTELTPPGGVSLVMQGPGKLTELGSNVMKPVTISAGSTQAFYVTLTTNHISYTNGNETGSIFVQNDDLALKEGAGKSYLFGATYEPRVFNGQIRYNVTSNNVTSNFCSNGTAFSFRLRTDEYGSDTSWTVKDTDNVTVASGSSYGSNAFYEEKFCLRPNACTFTISDSYGDGILLPGFYMIGFGNFSYTGMVDFNTTKTIDMCSGNLVLPATTMPTSFGSASVPSSIIPTINPAYYPTFAPTSVPTPNPNFSSSITPEPTNNPFTFAPTTYPTAAPTNNPTNVPTSSPISSPTSPASTNSTNVSFPIIFPEATFEQLFSIQTDTLNSTHLKAVRSVLENFARNETMRLDATCTFESQTKIIRRLSSSDLSSSSSKSHVPRLRRRMEKGGDENSPSRRILQEGGIVEIVYNMRWFSEESISELDDGSSIIENFVTLINSNLEKVKNDMLSRGVPIVRLFDVRQLKSV